MSLEELGLWVVEAHAIEREIVLRNQTNYVLKFEIVEQNCVQLLVWERSKFKKEANPEFAGERKTRNDTFGRARRSRNWRGILH